MFKFIICALLTLSLISSCQNENTEEEEEEEEEREELTGPPAGDPTEKYKLVNKTGDRGVVKVILFKSYKKLKSNDQTECAPRTLKNRECLTIKGNQFNLLKIWGDDDELVCGDIATACNPGNYEITKSGLFNYSYHLSTLTGEIPRICTPLECKTPDDDDDDEDKEDNEQDS